MENNGNISRSCLERHNATRLESATIVPMKYEHRAQSGHLQTSKSAIGR